MRVRLASGLVAAAIALTGALTGGCNGDPPGPVLSAEPVPAPPLPTTGPLSALDLIPESATVATMTDFDQMRVRFGVPDLTSADPMTDRNAFWEQVNRDAVLLTDGVFRAESSLWELDYGFTEDDVDWEVHFIGPEGSGYAVGLRPDLDLDGVRAALDTPQLDGVLLHGHVLEKATAYAGSWADDDRWGHLARHGLESAYLRKGCVPVADALGDARVDDPAYRHVLETAPDFDPLDAWSVSFGDGLVTVLLGLGRDDVILRTDLGEEWPATGPVTFADGFTQPLDDPETGRIGYQVVDPQAAASLTLGEELPFAVCDRSIPVIEPTGL